MFIDIHAHINDTKLLNNVAEVINNAKAFGVHKIVCASADVVGAKISSQLANKYECVYASVGLHPSECYDFNPAFEKTILSAKDNKKIVAVGEIGLDYHDLQFDLAEIEKKHGIKYSEADYIEKQKQVFIRQLELAHEIGLPVMIHMRDATNDTLNILEERKDLLTNGGLLHCYNGSMETTQRVFDLGFYISIGGAITFKNVKNMPEVLQEIGLDRVTLETDAPYLSPEPYRGRINEPKNIPLIAQKIANILDISIKEVEEKTTNNCYKVFPRLNNGK